MGMVSYAKLEQVQPVTVTRQRRDTVNPLRPTSPLAWPMLALFVILFTGIGIMLWHAPVPTDKLTLAQTNLINIGDWMVKASVGAILGVIGGARVARINGG